MSYILDALKKSEQERQRNSAPNLQSIQRASTVNRNGLNWQSVLLIVVLLLCCAMAAVIYWFVNQSPASSKAVEEVAPAPVQQPVEPAATVATEPAVTEPQLQPEPEPVKSGPVVRFVDLPDSVRQEIPAMTFSFHVFSDNPERRTIIINNRRVREQDSVSADLLLEEVTETGVIMNWKQRHRFSVEVVEEW